MKPWPPSAERPSSGARTVLLLWGLLAVACLSGSAALGQTRTTSGLAGTVTDEAGLSLPGAVVRIESPALIGGPRRVVTGKDGRFRFPELPLGKYDIEVSLSGYKSIEIEGTELSVGMNAEVPVKLIPFSLQEVVHVRARPVAIDPTSSSAPRS